MSGTSWDSVFQPQRLRLVSERLAKVTGKESVQPLTQGPTGSGGKNVKRVGIDGGMAGLRPCPELRRGNS